MVNKKIWAIILGAGESKRFHDEGFVCPKPSLLIEHKGKPLSMITHVANSVPASIYQRLAVYRAGVPMPTDLDALPMWVKATRGQADTAYQVVQTMLPHDGVLMLDCDMLLEREDLERIVTLMGIYDVVVAVTKTVDPNASRVDSAPLFTTCAEKQAISQWGIVGARGFSTAWILEKALQKLLEESPEEPYLSMAINNYPGSKYAYEITKFQDWGTPERIQKSGAKIL